jgi:hypothetical protein
MFARRLLFAQLFVLLFVHLTQRVGMYYFDLNPNNAYFVITHLLGGLWAGFFAAWLFALRGRKPSIIACVVAALTLGIVWELFEVVADLNFVEAPAYMSDTLSDLLMDMLGGFLGGILSFRLIRTNVILSK